MNLTLKRLEYSPNGIFSDLLDENNNKLASTLEHAYGGNSVRFQPKIPFGTFTCKRSMHRLHGMTSDFETFEITGVEGHTNLLFHWGNYEKDSDGCVLLGQDRVGDMVTNSRNTFAQFMKLQDGLPTFELTVTE